MKGISTDQTQIDLFNLDRPELQDLSPRQTLYDQTALTDDHTALAPTEMYPDIYQPCSSGFHQMLHLSTLPQSPLPVSTPILSIPPVSLGLTLPPIQSFLRQPTSSSGTVVASRTPVVTSSTTVARPSLPRLRLTPRVSRGPVEDDFVSSFIVEDEAT